MFKVARKKAKQQANALPKGFKAVPPPKKARRQLIESDDLTTSGGARTVHKRSTAAR